MIQVEPGDIVIVHAHHFLARGIQFFMNVYRWLQLDFKPFYKQVANHAGMGNYYNEIIEAAKEGVVSKNINEVYPEGCNRVVKVYRYHWTPEQIESINESFSKLKGKPYQFTNFLSFIAYILSFGLFWPGRKGREASNQIFCSEFDSTCIYLATAWNLAVTTDDNKAHKFFSKYWNRSPYQVEQWCEEYCDLVEVYSL